MSVAILLVPVLAAAEPAPQTGDQRAKDIAAACEQRHVRVSLAEAPGRDAAADRRDADRFLGTRSRIDDDSTLHWDRGANSEACRKKLAALAARYPDRLRFPEVERRRMAEASKRAQAQVPAAVRKDPANAALQAGLFDASRQLGADGAEAVSAGEGLRDALASAPGGASGPRAAMPSSFTRPMSEPPAPRASGGLPSGLADAVSSAYWGGGTRVRRGGMAIDTDGDLSGGDPHLASLARRDPDRQRETALRYAGGRSLDPTRVPFVVIPGGDRSAHLGDFVVVEYSGRRVLAIVGDVGPRNKFGEGSMALARQLGISPDGVRGGVDGGVTYTFLSSGVGRSPSGHDAVMAQLEAAQLALR